MTNVESFKKYLDCYSQKDLDSISTMLAENVTLRDWKISVSGKVAALDETRKNFQNARSIEIEILTSLESKNAVAGELKITVDESEILYVVDVITFNCDGYISSIKAYIGRED